MNKALTGISILLLVMALAGTTLAAEEVSIEGIVLSYVPELSISIKNSDGNHTFVISKDTGIEGDIKEGVRVQLEANGNMAIYIIAIEAEG